jgi:hypothetical protein
MSDGDALGGELPSEFESALKKLKGLFAGALGDAKLGSCCAAWSEIKVAKSRKKKIEVLNEQARQWREGSVAAVREWLPRFVDLAEAYKEALHGDALQWATDRVWELVEKQCGLRRRKHREPQGAEPISRTIVFWFAMASEGNSEVNWPSPQPWKAPPWLARNGKETDSLLSEHMHHLWLRLDQVINDETDSTEIQRAIRHRGLAGRSTEVGVRNHEEQVTAQSEELGSDDDRWSARTVRFGVPNSTDLKIWSQLDPQNNSLTRLKIKTARKDYRSELKTETSKILCDNRGKLNSMAIPLALFRMQLKKADEFAERQYSIFRDVWLQLAGVESAAFIRTISWKVIQPAFGVRGISVAHGQQMRRRRTGGLLPALSREAVCQAFDQLKSDWREKLETKALEWEAQSHGRALTAALHNSEGSAIPRRDKDQILAILGVTAPTPSPVGISATPKARSGRPTRLDSDFVDFAGGLWLNAKRRNLGSPSDSKALSKVTYEELAVIASSLDSKNYTPPARYLEKHSADEVRIYNSRHSNSKTGAIKTWSQLVFVADKNHLRGMRRLLSRCAKKQASA